MKSSRMNLPHQLIHDKPNEDSVLRRFLDSTADTHADQFGKFLDILSERMVSAETDWLVANYRTRVGFTEPTIMLIALDYEFGDFHTKAEAEDWAAYRQTEHWTTQIIHIPTHVVDVVPATVVFDANRTRM